MKKSFAAKLIPSLAMSLLCGGLTPAVFAASENVQPSSFARKLEASPCRGMKYDLSGDNKTDLERAFAKQLKVSRTKVIQSFKYGSWSLFYVENYVADPVYLFYSGNPLTNGYVGKSGGWFDDPNEAPKIKAWALKNVPGVPAELASCFAWYMTF